VLKLKVFATGVACLAMVIGSAGMAGAKQSHAKGPDKAGPVKVIMVNQGQDADWKDKGKSRGKSEKFGKNELSGEIYNPGPVLKHGRLLIPVNAITHGLGASITWNLPNSVKIEKDGKHVEIDLVKGVALVNGATLNLITEKGGHGRISLSPGMIKKLLCAAKSETLPAVIADDLIVGLGEEKEFTVSATNPQSGKAYQRALFKFTVANAALGDITEFQYKEGDTWKNISLSQMGSSVVGYSGPLAGFALPANYSATTTFRLRMAGMGTYNVDIRLVDLDSSEATIARDSMTVTVNTSTAAITAGDFEVFAGEEKEFAVSATNPQNGIAYQRSLYKFTVANAALSDITQFQYKEGDVWKNMPLSQNGSSVVGYFGPAGGFPLPANYSAITTFRLKIARAGTYSVDIRLVDLDSSEATIAQDSMTVTVKAVPAIITAGDQTMAANQLREFTVMAANPQNSQSYERVMFKFTLANATLSDIAQFQYKEGDVWKNMPLSQNGSSVVGYYGTVGGFPLPVNYSAATIFRLNITRIGTYNVDIRLVDLNNSEFTIAQDGMIVTVN